MSVHQLDYIFPFFVFAYGLLMTVVLHSPALVKLAQNRLPTREWQRFASHRGLGLICLLIGGLWSLQNLLIS